MIFKMKEAYIQFLRPLIWNSQYQRNNKANGHRNLRCFPQHSATGHSNGFCGSSVIIDFIFEKRTQLKRLCALARFREINVSCISKTKITVHETIQNTIDEIIENIVEDTELKVCCGKIISGTFPVNLVFYLLGWFNNISL